MSLTVRRREEDLKKKWEGVNDQTPVNESQYSLDNAEREEAYIRAQFSTPEELGRYRLYREEWYRRAKEFDPGDLPLAVTCELVSTCNLGCPMCYTITPEFQNMATGAQRMLPWPVVKSVIDECAALGIPSMLFSWRGESTLYRWRDGDTIIRFPDVLAYARRKGILEVTSLTHGQLIDEEMAKAIVDAEPNWISVSIDGLGKTYNLVRTPPNKKAEEHDAFRVVVDNIRRLVAIRDAQGQTRPQIRTNTVFPAIADDPQAYIAFMQEIGIGWLTINELLDFRGESLPDEAVRQDWSCQYPFQRLTVAASGVILPCTGAHREEAPLAIGRYAGAAAKMLRDTQGRDIEVDLPELTLAQAWASPKLEGVRRLHREGRRAEMRTGCRNCRHGAVKNGIEWIPDDWDRETMRWKKGIWRL